MDFDDKWITSFDENTKHVSTTIKVFYCYIDKDNVFTNMNQDIINIENEVITKNELIKLIIKHKKSHHKLFDIMSYIVDNVNEHTNFNKFFKSVKIDDILISSPHSEIDSLNCIFFMFKERNGKVNTKQTKKISLSSCRNTRRNLLK